jgi:hypothetical protein
MANRNVEQVVCKCEAPLNGPQVVSQGILTIVVE